MTKYKYQMVLQEIADAKDEKTRIEETIKAEQQKMALKLAKK